MVGALDTLAFAYCTLLATASETSPCCYRASGFLRDLGSTPAMVLWAFSWGQQRAGLRASQAASARCTRQTRSPPGTLRARGTVLGKEITTPGLNAAYRGFWPPTCRKTQHLVAWARSPPDTSVQGPHIQVRCRNSAPQALRTATSSCPLSSPATVAEQTSVSTHTPFWAFADPSISDIRRCRETWFLVHTAVVIHYWFVDS